MEFLTGLADKIWEKTAVVLGTGLGVGFSPIIPGTFGSLWGPVVVWLIRWSGLPNPAQVAVSVLLIAIGIPICERAAKWAGKDDPGSVVWDEIVAFPIVFMGLPLSPGTALWGFIWFRLFDMVKPWPIRKLERFHGGLGIMLDDQLAALFAWLALLLTVKIFELGT